MNPLIRDSIQYNVKKYTANTDELGRRQIVKRLSEAADPWITINEIRTDFALSCTESHSAIDFLHLLGCSSLLVHQSVHETLETSLFQEFKKFDQSKLLIMLQMTIHFLSVSGLKAIPIHLINSLNKVPEKYITYLAKNSNISELPLATRRQVWEQNEDLFIEALKDNIDRALANCAPNSDRKAMDAEIRKICEIIGPSELLFSKIANYCCRSSENDQRHWAIFLREFVIAKQSSDYKIPSLGKINELAWAVDICIRQKIENKTILSIVSILESLIISHGLAVEDASNLSRQRVPARLTVDNSQKDLGSSTIVRVEDDSKGPTQRSLGMDLKQVLMKAWKYVSKCDNQRIFAEKVTEAIAPGYFDVIKNPIDLSAIKKKIIRCSYTSFDQFVNDLELMFSNCTLFNEGTYIENYGNTVAEKWEKKMNSFKSLLSPIYQDQITPDSVEETEKHMLPTDEMNDGSDHIDSTKIKLVLPASADIKKQSDDKTVKIKLSINQSDSKVVNVASKSGHSIAKPSLSSSAEVLKLPLSESYILHRIQGYSGQKVLDELISIAIKALRLSDNKKIFEYAVDGQVVIDYYSIIKSPMYIQKIEENHALGAYMRLSDIDADVRLMIDNCYLYNGRVGFYAKVADKVLQNWTHTYQVLNSAQAQLGLSSSNRPDDELNISSVASEYKSESKFSIRVPRNDMRAVSKQTPLLKLSAKVAAVQKLLMPNINPIHVQEAIEILLPSDVPPITLYDAFEILWNLLVDIDIYGQLSEIMASEPFDIGILRIKIDRRVYRSFSDFIVDTNKLFKIKRHPFVAKDVSFQSNWGMIVKYVSEKYFQDLNVHEGSSETQLEIKSSVPSNNMDAPNQLVQIASTEGVQSNAASVVVSTSHDSMRVEEATLQNSLKKRKFDTTDVTSTEDPDQMKRKRYSQSVQEIQHHGQLESDTSNNYPNHISLNVSSDTHKIERKLDISRVYSLRKVVQFLKERSEVNDLPEAPLDDKLSWSLLILKDAVFQQSLMQSFARRIVELMHIDQITFKNYESYLAFTLPSEERICRILCQLSSFSTVNFTDNKLFPGLNDFIIRHIIPTVMITIMRNYLNGNLGKSVSDNSDIMQDIKAKLKDEFESLNQGYDDNYQNYTKLFVDQILSNFQGK